MIEKDGNDGGELFRYPRHEFVRVGKGFAAQNQAEHYFAGRLADAQIDVAEQTVPGFLIVGRNLVCLAEGADFRNDGGECRILQWAVRAREHAMAFCREETDGELTVCRPAHRVLRFVAVAVDSPIARKRGDIDLTQSLPDKTLSDGCLLQRALIGVVHAAEGTAAARRRNGAAVLDAVLGRHKNALCAGDGIGAADLNDAYACRVARDRAGNEQNAAVHLGNAEAEKIHIRDFNIKTFVFLQGFTLPQKFTCISIPLFRRQGKQKEVKFIE